ncbi:MAG: site-2 protease family protein [Pseudomonadota bacterium]|nr:site-2 protease family protein [Pseudomonadota bacterium]
MPDWLFDASAWVIPVVLAVTLHEAAHGWMAERFGDHTARAMGRISFNPLRHIDRFGTIILPALLLLLRSPVLFGYARPVPVNFRNLTPPRLGMFMVAMAGPGTNVLLALISGLLLHLEAVMTPEQAPWLFLNLYRSLMINCVLAVFNLIPILPLDGGRVVASLLSGGLRRAFDRLERYGIVIVLLGLLVPPLLGFDLAQHVIGRPATWLLEQVMGATGNGSAEDTLK